MIGFVRGVAILAGVAAVGALLWVASGFDLETTDGFWAVVGLLAGGGFVLGASRLVSGGRGKGRLRLSPPVLALGCLPAFVATGWILLATQPEGGWQQGRLAGWSDDLGIGEVVSDLGAFPAVLAFGMGLVAALALVAELRAAEPVPAEAEAEDEEELRAA